MIKNEDSNVLSYMFDLLKDIKNKNGINLYYLPKYIIEKYSENLKDTTMIKIEFQRLSEFFIITELAHIDERKYGLYLVPKNKIYESNFYDINEDYKKIIKRENRKIKKEDIEYKMTWWKYYLFWPLTILTVVSTGVAIKQTTENLKNQDIIEELEQKIEYMESEQSKQNILPLNHKNQDSSSQTSSDKETSTQKKN